MGNKTGIVIIAMIMIKLMLMTMIISKDVNRILQVEIELKCK